MAYTGGLLNELNGKMGISAPYKSVSVMKLIRIHKPKSKKELVELINWHAENICDCGIISQGSVESFGHNLYNSQITYWGEKRFSLKECIQWEYDLFVVQSLKGGIIEKKAISCLKTYLKPLNVIEAEGYIDEELRIDLIILKDSIEISGIQIKPKTFKFMRKEVISYNQNANQKWNKPVYYLYYDENENFINLSETLSNINILLNKNEF